MVFRWLTGAGSLGGTGGQWMGHVQLHCAAVSKRQWAWNACAHVIRLGPPDILSPQISSFSSRRPQVTDGAGKVTAPP